MASRSSDASAGNSLRARKQRRTREQIVQAAYELFAERGFDAVTVAEIAARAEVGRTTFFRYFGDKQEVLFAEDPELLAGLAAHIRGDAGAPGAAATADADERPAPIGDSLAGALTLIRDAALAAFARGAEQRSTRVGVLLGLLARHPDLRARHLLKQEQQADLLGEALLDRGASPEVATLAPQLALACLRAAGKTAGATPASLPAAFEGAVDRVISQSQRQSP